MIKKSIVTCQIQQQLVAFSFPNSMEELVSYCLSFFTRFTLMKKRPQQHFLAHSEVAIKTKLRQIFVLYIELI